MADTHKYLPLFFYNMCNEIIIKAPALNTGGMKKEQVPSLSNFTLTVKKNNYILR